MTHYLTLGARPVDATSTLRARYHELMRVHHPDRGGDEALAASINEAWAVLGDVKKRREYDNLLALTMSACTMCKGTGGRVIMKRFKSVGTEVCSHCKGAGYLPRATRKTAAATNVIELSGTKKPGRKRT